MALWTDIIDPGTLTGYAREALKHVDGNGLAQYLPNKTTSGNTVKVYRGDNGLVDEARWRAYDAEPEIAGRKGGKATVIELPALSINIPVSEFDQLQLMGASDEALRQEILRTTDQAVNAVAATVERMRGSVLSTGKATYDQQNFNIEDDFGRDPELTVTAGTLWSETTANPIDDIEKWVDLFVEKNGVTPTAIIASRKVANIIARSEGAKGLFGLGAGRPGIAALNDALVDNDLPMIDVYNGRTKKGPIVPTDHIVMVNSQGLGDTQWGRTLTSLSDLYSLAETDQPGLVTGVYRGEKPPMIAEVIADSIVLPIVANANLTLGAKVL